ncbi:MAG: MBL fold metallo-hydrolase, partial [Lentisphaerae bacterium]|nr:MBL fold metallo-hydrolase [Lentisphaerota bacterium]
MVKIVFMGTGTSVGVPAIGCRCRVCRSRDPRNRRRRAALYIEAGGRHLVIDTPPDFREQVLSCGVRRVDALLYTHAHSDHVCGLDDVRRFCEIQRQTIPVYAAATTLRALSRSFAYIHRTPRPGLSYPRVDFRPAARPFRIGRICVTPLPVEHAGIVTQGYRVAAGGG